MNRIYLAALLALALLASVFFHPLVGVVFFAVGMMFPILPAWAAVLARGVGVKLSRFLAFGVLALALPLGGCAKLTTAYNVITQTTVTQQQAAAALQAFNIAEAAANTYLSLPPCKSGETTGRIACRDKAAAATLNAALDKGDAYADTLLDDIKQAKAAGTGIGIVKAAFDAVTSSTIDVQAATPVTVAN